MCNELWPMMLGAQRCVSSQLSVSFMKDIPESIDGTWLSGQALSTNSPKSLGKQTYMLLCSQVYVTIKNNLFEASEANKALAEIALLLLQREGVNPNV